MARRAVFLDRDGVINRSIVRSGVSHPPATVAELEILPGVADACAKLAAAGYWLVVVTNQPDVARGITKFHEVEAINAQVRAVLPVNDLFVCYHDGPDNCACRKPRPGMLVAAAARWDIDLTSSYMVGDRWSDIAAGQAVGCRSVLVVTPESGRDRCQPDHCVHDLAEAAEWILHRETRHEAVC